MVEYYPSCILHLASVRKHFSSDVVQLEILSSMVEVAGVERGKVAVQTPSQLVMYHSCIRAWLRCIGNIQCSVIDRTPHGGKESLTGSDRLTWISP